ncbi:MAG: allergen V5/Tpx-1 family protein [Parcubacteria group bacterium Gr01-1014_20]|nr:MAG: allergen V5/Tpx-1 family protein [Parcubacteria group bacterium Gr01-1014_20]
MDLKQLFKKYFIPHAENDHRPHFLRRERVVYAIALLVIFETLFLLGNFLVFPQSKFLAAILPNVLVDYANEARGGQSLVLLKLDPNLAKGAQMKAEDMAARGYFAHVSPEGVTPWYWFDQADYNFVYAGENLAINFTDSREVTNAWLASPTHRANILNNHFTEVGIGVAEGLYEGRNAFFVVQFFGRPMPAVISEELQVVLTVPPREVSPEENQIAAHPSETFVAVQGAEFIDDKISDVLETPVLSLASPIERIASQPKTLTNYVYLIFAAVVGFALLLKILIKIKIQHPDLILNGVFMLLIILWVVVFNNELVEAVAAVL